MHPSGRIGGGDVAAPLSAVVVIPARFHSTRLPGQALADVGGRPMIEHVYRRAVEAPGIDRVIVATDDERIRAVVEAFGGTAVMTSPHHRSGTERVAEVAETLTCDLVVNVQGDEPLLHPAMIGEAVAPFSTDPALQVSTLCRRASPDEFRDPNVVKVVRDRQGDALYFSRAGVPFGRGLPANFVPDASFKHIGMYVYRRAFLLTLAAWQPTPLEQAEALEQLRVLEHGYRIRVAETHHDSTGVDTEEDLERVRREVAGASR